MIRAVPDRLNRSYRSQTESLGTLRAAMMAALVWAICAIAASAQAPLHDPQYADADIAYGATLYTSRCVTCHGPQGDGIGGVNLRTGTFKTAITDRDLDRVIRSGSPAGMPKFDLDAAEMAGVIAYIRNMNAIDASTVKTGDAVRGRALFTGKGNCQSCHRVGPAGSRVAPNLSDIGAVRSPGSLERSLLDPNSQMMPINRPVRVVTKDGTVINGRRLNEDTYGLQIIDDHERLHSLVKADLREFTIAKTSPMPSFKETFSTGEIADLLAYLLTLKGQ
jgi:putative heme-binding domain-containing protein